MISKFLHGAVVTAILGASTTVYARTQECSGSGTPDALSTTLNVRYEASQGVLTEFYPALDGVQPDLPEPQVTFTPVTVNGVVKYKATITGTVVVHDIPNTGLNNEIQARITVHNWRAGKHTEIANALAGVTTSGNTITVPFTVTTNPVLSKNDVNYGTQQIHVTIKQFDIFDPCPEFEWSGVGGSWARLTGVAN